MIALLFSLSQSTSALLLTSAYEGKNKKRERPAPKKKKNTDARESEKDRTYPQNAVINKRIADHMGTIKRINELSLVLSRDETRVTKKQTAKAKATLPASTRKLCFENSALPEGIKTYIMRERRLISAPAREKARRSLFAKAAVFSLSVILPEIIPNAPSMRQSARDMPVITIMPPLFRFLNTVKWSSLLLFLFYHLFPNNSTPKKAKLNINFLNYFMKCTCNLNANDV